MKKNVIKVAQLVLCFVVFAPGVSIGMEKEILASRSNIDDRISVRLSDHDKRDQQVQDLQDRFNIIASDQKFIQRLQEWVCIFLEEEYQNRNRRLIDPDVLVNIKNHLESLNTFYHVNMKKLDDLQKELNEVREVIKSNRLIGLYEK